MRRFFRIFIITLIIFGLVLYYKTTVETFIINILSDSLKAYSTQSVNDAILRTINNNPYKELIKIDKNPNKAYRCLALALGADWPDDYKEHIRGLLGRYRETSRGNYTYVG